MKMPPKISRHNFWAYENFRKWTQLYCPNENGRNCDLEGYTLTNEGILADIVQWSFLTHGKFDHLLFFGR